jgi:hypothetical protein
MGGIKREENDIDSRRRVWRICPDPMVLGGDTKPNER